MERTHPAATGHVRGPLRRRQPVRRRHVRAHQGGDGQLHRRIHDGARQNHRGDHRGTPRHHPRLRTRHTAQQAFRCGIEDEHRRQVRRQHHVPQVGRTERRRRKGGERPLQRIHRPQRARRPGPHGQLLARLRALGPLGGGGAGKKRSVGELRPRRRRKDIRQLRLQLRVRGTHVPPLYLPQSGADGEVQRQGLSFEERSARPAQRQPFRGAALPAHPPDGRGHRGSHHPRQRLRRNLLLVRERPVHHTWRHSPGGFPGGGGENRQGILQERLRPGRRAHLHHRGAQHQGRKSHVREPAQDQVRLEGRGRGRPIGAQFHHGFRQGAAGRLPAHAPRDGQCAGQEGGLQREGTQGHIGRPEEGARNGQEGEPQQQETARLQDTPERRKERPPVRHHDFHYGRQLGERFHHRQP